MCLSSTPDIPKPVPPQDVKQAESSAGVSTARRNAQAAGGMASSTLLTGPSGVENASLNLGKTSLLGQ